MPGPGWQKVAPEGGGAPGDALLESVLVEAVLQHNPQLYATPDRARAVAAELRRISKTARTKGVKSARAELLPWLLGQRSLPGGPQVRVFDFAEADENALAYATAAPVQIGEGTAEAGAVFYVNGLPLAVVESDLSGAGKWTDAADRIVWLLGAAPELSAFVAVCVAVDAAEIRYGRVGVKPSKWTAWTPPPGEVTDAVAAASRTVLTPTALLDQLLAAGLADDDEDEAVVSAPAPAAVVPTAPPPPPPAPPIPARPAGAPVGAAAPAGEAPAAPAGEAPAATEAEAAPPAGGAPAAPAGEAPADGTDAAGAATGEAEAPVAAGAADAEGAVPAAQPAEAAPESQPAPDQPPPAEPAPAEPAAGEPAAAEPAAGEPAGGEPAAVQAATPPGPAQPGPAQPRPLQPRRPGED